MIVRCSIHSYLIRSHRCLAYSASAVFSCGGGKYICASHAARGRSTSEMNCDGVVPVMKEGEGKCE